MCAQVVMAGYQSASLSVDVGVKQGCVLAPIIFDLFLVVAMTLVCVAVTSNHLIAVELSIVLMVISSQSILVTWVRCRFLETVIDGSNPGCISTLCLRAKHLICIASVDSAGKWVRNGNIHEMSLTLIVDIPHNYLLWLFPIMHVFSCPFYQRMTLVYWRGWYCYWFVSLTFYTGMYTYVYLRIYVCIHTYMYFSLHLGMHLSFDVLFHFCKEEQVSYFRLNISYFCVGYFHGNHTTDTKLR